MDGKRFVAMLSDEFNVKITPATKSQWKDRSDISPTVLRNALKSLEHQKLSTAIVPICEFHPLVDDHGANVDSFANRQEELKAAIGIYAFFQAGGRLLYVGKTEKNNLFNEMQQRYWHKSVAFKVLKAGKAVKTQACIAEMAYYVSAYKVDRLLITNVEALLTRMIINNASNIRVEGFLKSAKRGRT
jgi:hypothetical protein